MNKSQMRIRPNFLLGLLVLFVIGYLASLSLPTLSGKPKGNRFAIIACRAYVIDVQNLMPKNADLDFRKLSENDKYKLTRWARDFDFLAKTNFVWETNTNKEIVIVCSMSFDNVPRPSLSNFYRRNRAHAVGYSDGTTGLISPQEFTNLNLNSFVALSSL
jgi:hypothetical protein